MSVAQLRYSPNLIGDATPSACMLRKLCGLGAQPLAAVTERWFADLAVGHEQLRRRLLSVDDTDFWSAWWELAYARVFSTLGFDVEIEPHVDGQTPDLRVQRANEAAYVEVLYIGPSQEVQVDEARVATLGDQLRSIVTIPNGWLTIMVGEMMVDPGDTDVTAVADAVQGFIRDHPEGGRVEISEGVIEGWGRWFTGKSPGRLHVAPSGRQIGGHRRWLSRIGEKLYKYGHLTVADNRLIVATGFNHWTMTATGVIDALFGQDQVVINRSNPDDWKEERSGFGVLVPESPNGYAHVCDVSGVFIGGFPRVAESDMRCRLDLSYLHNPYSLRAFANDWLHPVSEWQRADEQLVTTGPSGSHFEFE